MILKENCATIKAFRKLIPESVFRALPERSEFNELSLEKKTEGLNPAIRPVHIAKRVMIIK